ncbi:MAG TPA: hypothetical protein PK110_05010 [Niabella sp.]|nr:hypothetical protein [Niabella sp.]
MNWIKKKLEQLSAKLNAEEELLSDTSIQKTEPEKVADEPKIDNIEELKEISIGAITKAVRMLSYGKSVVSGLVFHSKFADNAVENVGLQALIKDEEFIKRIKRDFKSKGIKFKDDLSVEVLHESPLMEKVTKITEGIGVEALTPTETLKKILARIKATEGITWEEEYILEPTGKQYFIGRCKNPKIENGSKIHNDIAFIGIEENDEEQYKINNYVSRSHALIVFDKEAGAYKIYRSRFMNNFSHKIKIYNTGLNDYEGVSLNQPQVPHILRDGDSICFNDKIILEFSIIK